MTPQEASEELKEEFEKFKDGIDPEHWENPNKELRKIIEANAMAIEVLEQHSCEDAISRQTLIERINNAEENFKSDNMESIASDDGDLFVDGVLSGVFNIRQMVMQAPSVNPKPKMGRWIPDDTICEDTLYRCSNCDNVYYSDYGDVKDMGYNFCPNCGAKMESDGEE